jgi:hypothetical protein
LLATAVAKLAAVKLGGVHIGGVAIGGVAVITHDKSAVDVTAHG